MSRGVDAMTGHEVTLDVTVTARRFGPGEGDRPACLGCGGPLELSQPDVRDPGRMLGTCAPCRRWHLVQRGPGPGGGVLFTLPGPRGRAGTPRRPDLNTARGRGSGATTGDR